ncbi:hypothetical protein [Streptomyces sp. NPDC059649]|uniref:preATP grasp domain-containing protein n=1 Tax=Streptomyces sp. NPDC059649 TaxID=3346895 RepID=UPI0036BF09D6
MEENFSRRLKTAVAGDPGASLVFLGNFEVEEEWARGETGLPRLSSAGNSAVVNRMEEFALLLGDADDHVVLKTRPDEDYLDHLRGLGLTLPTVHVVADQRPQHMVTRDALADDALIATLGELAGRGALLAPHGVSAPEEELAARSGIPLAAPPAPLCKAVNSKVYSRRAADAAGLRQPRGWASETLEELDTVMAHAAELCESGVRLMVKEAYGVSGKGIAVVDSRRRLDRLHTVIVRGARAAGSDRAAFVIEELVAKERDLNYQITVGRDGTVRLDFVKEALTEGGVHKGHRFPPDLTPGQLDEIRHAARVLGKQLASDGFFGVAGIDALVDTDGGVFPVIEINARNNMSTYQARLQEHLLTPGRSALARHYPLRLRRELPFAAVRRLLDGLLLRAPGEEGLVVNNFATVNAGAGAAPYQGRLYALLVGAPERLPALDRAVSEHLAALMEEPADGR